LSTNGRTFSPTKKAAITPAIAATLSRIYLSTDSATFSPTHGKACSSTKYAAFTSAIVSTYPKNDSATISATFSTTK
jgi:hypothetical protein